MYGTVHRALINRYTHISYTEWRRAHTVAILQYCNYSDWLTWFSWVDGLYLGRCDSRVTFVTYVRDVTYVTSQSTRGTADYCGQYNFDYSIIHIYMGIYV
jgi:hypothetical protein